MLRIALRAHTDLRRSPITRCEMDQITEQTDQVTIVARWHIEAPRASVYAIASDFEALPANFPRLAHSAKIVSREGNRLRVEAEAASFGRLFPRVNVAIDAELLLTIEADQGQTNNPACRTAGTANAD